MSKCFGKYGPKWPRLGLAWYHFYKLPTYPIHRLRKIYRLNSRYAKSKLSSLRAKLDKGETVYLAGIGPCGHNSGVSLISASRSQGIRMLLNNEEERMVGIKHYPDFPAQSIGALECQMKKLGLAFKDIHAWIATWDYPSLAPLGMKSVFEEFPSSFSLFFPSSLSVWNFWEYEFKVWRAAKRLGTQIGLNSPQPIIASQHHDNHAAAAYCLSPFDKTQGDIMVAVLDGWGDEGAISTYSAQNGKIQTIRKNLSPTDSLGTFYSILSSTQGGWTILSSEGRFMGAAAWGNMDRLTNPYYKGLREIFHFAPEGQIFINRSMANWQNKGELNPYKKPLIDLIGPPIPREKMWNPDHVLNVEKIQHSEITKERVDIAAATQLVFEDALFHIVEHLIRTTKSDKLVMAGGSALNCLANMKLLETFNEDWYRKNLKIDTRLHLWVPPFPGDAGVPAGAAMNFALKMGAKPSTPMRHAFYCGSAPQIHEIDAAIASDPEIDHRKMGNVNIPEDLESLTDFMAFLLSKDGVVGLFQGPAETGPRALGHRSILANPCNPLTLETINQLVKYREPLRPLAPMATLKAAQELFELSPGAAEDNFNAYNYMVMTVRARPLSYKKIPSVVHRDGTVRLQLVRPEYDAVSYSLLKAMGRRLGVEVSVNTSLNVGSPIVQTPPQAIQVLKKAKALTLLVMIGEDGSVRLAWHKLVSPPKDGGRQLGKWFEEWALQRKLTAVTL